jgi:uncharacterized membrane protein
MRAVPDNPEETSMSSLATATLAAAIGLALTVPAQAQQDKPMTKEQKMTMERMVKHNLEKCYGVAARGKNDCAEGAHSCVGQATRDRDPTSFVLVPKGDCQKLAGGKTQAS